MIAPVGKATFILKTEQYFPVPRKQAFSFFEDPRNLFGITPGWLDFRMDGSDAFTAVSEGAKFSYRIRWLGIGMGWRSKIVNYRPPDEFTDIQILGPYRSWQHTHRFESRGQGTFMTDEVRYTLPFSWMGTFSHTVFIKKQLRDIFCYRAAKILEWVNQQENSTR